jgi:hypothetical protein
MTGSGMRTRGSSNPAVPGGRTEPARSPVDRLLGNALLGLRPIAGRGSNAIRPDARRCTGFGQVVWGSIGGVEEHRFAVSHNTARAGNWFYPRSQIKGEPSLRRAPTSLARSAPGRASSHGPFPFLPCAYLGKMPQTSKVRRKEQTE